MWLKFWVFITVGIGLTFLGRTSLLQDDDTIWHSVVGKRILEARELVWTDSFSFTFHGEPWIAHQWTGECLLALARYVAGWGGVIVLAATILAWLAAWLVDRFYTRGADPVLAIFFVSLGFSASAYNLLARPHLGTIGLLAISFGVLNDVDSNRRRLSTIYWLIPIHLLWSNLHGGTLGGLGTIGLIFSGWTMGYIVRWDVPVRSVADILKIWTVFLLSLATVIATPYGIETPKSWLRILGSSLEELVVEHAPLDPFKPEGIAVVVLMALYAGVLLTTRRGPRITWLIPVIWGYLTITRIRHGALFSVVVLIVLADMMRSTRMGELLSRRDFWRDEDQPRKFRQWNLVIVTVTLSWGATIYSYQNSGRDWARPSPEIWPSELSQDLIHLTDSTEPVPVFNSFELAGFIIDQAPQAQVFIDSRCELYGEHFLRAYVNGAKSPDAFDDWVRQYDIRLAFVEAKSVWDTCLRDSPEWELVRESKVAVLYRRKE